MKKEARLLLSKAIDSLITSIEHFNSPSNLARVSIVLIMMDHAFEMLLKAAILHKGGRIREKKAPQTIGFDACVRKAYSDGQIKFLTEEQTLQLQAINGLRDAAQHHLLDISEQHLYLQIQGGLTLFGDILKSVFERDLKNELPERVLPISTIPPTDLITVFENDVTEVQKLLQGGRRKKIEAIAKLRSLAIVEGALTGSSVQPDSRELLKLADGVANGKEWNELFPGVAMINLSASEGGQNLNLRITKKEGIPVHLVPEGTAGAKVIAIKRVDELGFYNLGRDQVADKLGLTKNKTTAMIWFLKIKDDPECFKEIRIGSSRFGRYSQKVLKVMKDSLDKIDIDEVWIAYIKRNTKKFPS